MADAFLGAARVEAASEASSDEGAESLAARIVVRPAPERRAPVVETRRIGVARERSAGTLMSRAKRSPARKH